MDSLTSELPYYMATADGVATTMCAKEWWKGHHQELPHWASVYRRKSHHPLRANGRFRYWRTALLHNRNVHWKTIYSYLLCYNIIKDNFNIFNVRIIGKNFGPKAGIKE